MRWFSQETRVELLEVLDQLVDLVGLVAGGVLLARWLYRQLARV